MQKPAHEPDQHPPGSRPERTAEDVMWRRVERRRERIRSQVHHARHGKHRIPTWVLATLLGILLLGWAYLLFFN